MPVSCNKLIVFLQAVIKQDICVIFIKFITRIILSHALWSGGTHPATVAVLPSTVTDVCSLAPTLSTPISHHHYSSSYSRANQSYKIHCRQQWRNKHIPYTPCSYKTAQHSSLQKYWQLKYFSQLSELLHNVSHSSSTHITLSVIKSSRHNKRYTKAVG